MAINEASGGRGCLFVIAAGHGCWAAALVAQAHGLGEAAIAFFAVGLGYSLLAAVAVEVCKGLRYLAFPGASAWDGDTAAMWGAFWPLSLVFWLLITPFFALINRLFK